ncbi:MAG: type II toxin-antitoxin system CcdA family antitoxin [Cellvibrio sp.]|uniref:type II toxin-antitoxin system CcdA family antitoxin n=1 Tax=Cellvibrio sp. TaxID=1965322 RepID=UPI0031ACCDAE
MNGIYDPSAPKKATNLSINSELLRKAKEFDINLSATLEQALIEKVKQRQRELWLSANKSAIDDYNSYAEQNGQLSDSLRSF